MSNRVLVVRKPVGRLVVRGESTQTLVVEKPVAKLVTTTQRGLSGRNGVDGQLGLGQITYSERVVEPSDFFTPGVKGRIRFTPSVVQDFLNPPFKDHQFWVDDKLVAREVGDLYEITVNLIVTAQVADGQLRIEADVGSLLGPVASDTQTLFDSAAAQERVTFNLKLQVLDNFKRNGCALYLISSVPLVVASETVLVAPASVYQVTQP